MLISATPVPVQAPIPWPFVQVASTVMPPLKTPSPTPRTCQETPSPETSIRSMSSWFGRFVGAPVVPPPGCWIRSGSKMYPTFPVGWNCTGSSNSSEEIWA